jgi:hypothetical protein
MILSRAIGRDLFWFPACGMDCLSGPRVAWRGKGARKAIGGGFAVRLTAADQGRGTEPLRRGL